MTMTIHPRNIHPFAASEPIFTFKSLSKNNVHNIMPLFSSSKKDKKAANEFKAVYGSTSKYHEFDSSSSSSRSRASEKQEKAVKKERGKLTPYELWVAEQRRRMER